MVTGKNIATLVGHCVSRLSVRRRRRNALAPRLECLASRVLLSADPMMDAAMFAGASGYEASSTVDTSTAMGSNGGEMSSSADYSMSYYWSAYQAYDATASYGMPDTSSDEMADETSDSAATSECESTTDDASSNEAVAVTSGTESMNAESGNSDSLDGASDGSSSDDLSASDSEENASGDQGNGLAAFTQNNNQNQQNGQSGYSVSATSNWDGDGNQFVLLNVSGLSAGESLMAEFDGAMNGYVQLVCQDGEYMVMLNQPTFGWAGVQLVNSSGDVVAEATFTLN